MRELEMFSTNDFHGTIKAQANFNEEIAADELQSAMRGFGVDKQRVMRLITRINNAQRQMIRTPYRQKYNKDLINDLRKELSGDLEEVILALMETPTKYDVVQLHGAIQGIGTKETTLTEILASRTNDELWAIRNEYRTQFRKTLEQDVYGDTSGDYRDLLVALLQGNRGEDYMINSAKAREDARRLVGDEKTKVKPDKLAYRTILTNQNPRQLAKVFTEFENLAGYPIEEGIKNSFGGDAAVAYLAVVQCIRNTAVYFAHQLYNAMKGLGTRDSDLIRVIVSRSEIDLAIIKEEFRVLYKRPLVDFIKSECSGAYRDCLVSLVNGN